MCKVITSVLILTLLAAPQIEIDHGMRILYRDTQVVCYGGWDGKLSCQPYQSAAPAVESPPNPSMTASLMMLLHKLEAEIAALWKGCGN
jgi:hypothetical protein